MAFLLKLERHIHPNDQKVSEKNIRFADLDIPRALQSYDPKLAILSSLLLPDQDMANWVNREIAVATSKDPPFSRIWPQSFPNPLGCQMKATIPQLDQSGRSTQNKLCAPCRRKN